MGDQKTVQPVEPNSPKMPEKSANEPTFAEQSKSAPGENKPNSAGDLKRPANS